MRDAYPLSRSPGAVSFAGLLVVAADLAIISLRPFGPQDLYGHYALRGGVAVLALLVMLLSRRATPSDFGFSVTGWRSDFVWVMKVALVVLGAYVVLAAAGIAAVRIGWLPRPDLKMYADFTDVAGMKDYILSGLICAPLVEELVYRAFAVPSLAAGFGRRWAIFLSGPIFYCLHIAYGRPPLFLHYTVAGWILAWALVRRGRLWVPVLLHFLGNVLMAADDVLLLYAPGVVEWLLPVAG
ncbi:MAG: lysostaphin resistance A-like protein [Planctomycetota bacterium]|jgi:membrane protease YdiL (CAAX protease family)